MTLIIISLIAKIQLSIYKDKQLDVLSNADFAKENASWILIIQNLTIVIFVAIS